MHTYLIISLPLQTFSGKTNSSLNPLTRPLLSACVHTEAFPPLRRCCLPGPLVSRLSLVCFGSSYLVSFFYCYFHRNDLTGKKKQQFKHIYFWTNQNDTALSKTVMHTAVDTNVTGKVMTHHEHPSVCLHLLNGSAVMALLVQLNP